MRIIAGKFRGRKLKSPPSLEVRPTLDRLRETLFNIIADRVDGAVFLDLCAGSGAVGIEALSRGAVYVTFVDRSRKMCQLIRANLDLCRIPEEEAEVVQAEALEFVRRAIKHHRQPSDVVFFDPPYASNYLEVMVLLGQASHLFTEAAVLIVEHHHKKDLPEEVGKMVRKRLLKQGDSALSFYINTRSSQLRHLMPR
ncbi:MAG TPA: 16S rRNA (guanine(966)-N(2))-methyltransferase RsmD [Pyrinomonadaceae bacterium]|nr:16S rRNA (guanine(966)-N(2))-methyltransferase RsmD [Pyrinomonadaceae bacterium]